MSEIKVNEVDPREADWSVKSLFRLELTYRIRMRDLGWMKNSVARNTFANLLGADDEGSTWLYDDGIRTDVSIYCGDISFLSKNGSPDEELGQFVVSVQRRIDADANGEPVELQDKSAEIALAAERAKQAKKGEVVPFMFNAKEAEKTVGTSREMKVFVGMPARLLQKVAAHDTGADVKAMLVPAGKIYLLTEEGAFHYDAIEGEHFEFVDPA